MGSGFSSAAHGVGAFIGNVIAAPFKSFFGISCEGICSGTWDVACFVEHFCISNLIRLVLVLCLCYISLVFLYLVFKLGIIQCVGKSICKMCWAACKAYWFALEGITCFCWDKLSNVKRVNRRHRFQDIEIGYNTSSESESSVGSGGVSKKQKRARRTSRRQGSIHLSSRHSSRDEHGSSCHQHHQYQQHHHHHHHQERLKRGTSLSIGGKVGSTQGGRRSRQAKMRRLHSRPRKTVGFKRKKVG